MPANHIFDEVKRSDKRSKYFNESSFDYYNMSARPGMAGIRELIERWYADSPSAGKTDIRGRLRSGRQTDFLSAFFELYMCQLSRALGFSVEIYPEMSHHARKSHPDFILSHEGEPALYVEATLAQEPQSTVAARRRQAELEDAINQVRCADFWLLLDTSGTATENIPVAKAKKKIQQWLDELNVEQVARDVEIMGDAALPTFSDSYGALTITITANPKGPDIRGSSEIPPLGMVAPDELLEWETRDDIRQAVLRKAKCYGDLKLPYIIAINVINDLMDFDDILDGLFGRPTLELRRGPQGISQRRLVRAGWRLERKEGTKERDC